MNKTRLLWATATFVFIQSTQIGFAQNVVLVGPNQSGTISPIEQVTLNDNGTIVVQNESQPTSTNIQRSTPVTVSQIVLENGDELDIFNFEGAEVVLQNLAVQSPAPTGIGVIQSDGTQVTLSGDGPTAFADALEVSLGDPNINTYVFYDGVTPDPTENTPDYDLEFRFAFEPDDYIFVQERNGNTFFQLTPLDINGNPIAGANILQFGEEGGANFSVYDWNTGYANSSLQNEQEYAFSVAETSLFFSGDATAAPQPVFGFRIDNDGDADVKFFGASEDDFLNNPFNPDIPGTPALPGSLSGVVEEDTDEDGEGDTPIGGVTLSLIHI